MEKVVLGAASCTHNTVERRTYTGKRILVQKAVYSRKCDLLNISLDSDKEHPYRALCNCQVHDWRGSACSGALPQKCTGAWAEVGTAPGPKTKHSYLSPGSHPSLPSTFNVGAGAKLETLSNCHGLQLRFFSPLSSPPKKPRNPRTRELRRYVPEKTARPTRFLYSPDSKRARSTPAKLFLLDRRHTKHIHIPARAIMSASLPGSRELPASQYDLSTYWGRVRHSADISDPR